MSANRTDTGRKEWEISVRRKVLQVALVLVLALTMLMAFAPDTAAAAGPDSYDGGAWSGWYSWAGGCSTCEVKNHNETLVEDEE